MNNIMEFWPTLGCSTPKTAKSAICEGLRHSQFGWYRVNVYSNCGGDQDTLSKLLKQLADLMASQLTPLKTLYLQTGSRRKGESEMKPNLTFYVNNYNLAKNLHSLKLPGVLQLHISDNNPRIKMTKNYWKLLRLVILSRYDAGQSALDLSSFHSDELWQIISEFCALTQYTCLSAVIKVMEHEMPTLRTLVLDNNFLKSLCAFKGIECRLPNLEVISLQTNEVKNIKKLRVFRHLPIVSINFKQNPIKFRLEQVLKLFPKLCTLNTCILDTEKKISHPDYFQDPLKTIDLNQNICNITPIVKVQPESRPKPRVLFTIPELKRESSVIESHKPLTQCPQRKLTFKDTNEVLKYKIWNPSTSLAKSFKSDKKSLKAATPKANLQSYGVQAKLQFLSVLKPPSQNTVTRSQAKKLEKPTFAFQESKTTIQKLETKSVKRKNEVSETKSALLAKTTRNKTKENIRRERTTLWAL